MKGSITVVAFALVLFALALSSILTHCSTPAVKEKTHGPPLNPEPETHVIPEDGRLVIVHLNDGTRCAVWTAIQRGGVTCDWARNEIYLGQEFPETSEELVEKRPL